VPTSITFFGAADTVTGSRYLVEFDGTRVLVDCGLFQGLKKLRERNWAGLPFEASSVAAVLLTHAHIDHTGYLPKLCMAGFSGPAYCTPGTRDLLQILLPDSGFLQEEEARYANLRGYAKHHPALPLYTREDAERSLETLTARSYYERFQVAPGISARFSRAGHILGSACLELQLGETTLTFTGDVGRPGDPIMKPADPLGRADFLVCESTYGDRRHPSEDITSALAGIVNDTAKNAGVVLVPAFAVGRAQHLLYLLAQLKQARQIPDLPVFLDSPMAINATELFSSHREEHRLSEDQSHLISTVARYSHTPEESRAIDERSGPMIIISASGMATGGRILHHLRRFLPEKQHSVVFVGYQAAGTRGRSLVDGADELKIHGQYVKVRARIAQLQGLSAHADAHELLEWLEAGSLSPQRVFVTHGEPGASDAFRRRLRDTFGWNAVVPDHRSTWSLSAAP
jgi:metallo-beta-lactamase family protein